MNICTNIINQYEPTELYFFIASSWGDVDSGFVLYNYLLSLREKVKITMHNNGHIDSIANIIFLSGEKRYAFPNSSFLFHGISLNLSSALVRTQLHENLSRVVSMEKRMSEVIVSNSALMPDEVEELFQQGESKDVNFALKKKIIHEIKVQSIPKWSLHFTMTFT